MYLRQKSRLKNDETTSTLKNILILKQEMLLLVRVKRIGLKILEVKGGKIIGGFKPRIALLGKLENYQALVALMNISNGQFYM